MSEHYIEVKGYYDEGYWNLAQVKYAAYCGFITIAEFEEITGETYVAPTNTLATILPSVSTADNDKIAKIVNGKWVIDYGYILKTVTAELIHITDAVAKPMPSAIAYINPVQDLHGYSYPWLGGDGTNVMPYGEAKTATENGLTFTSDGKGTYTVTGTASADTEVFFDLVKAFTAPQSYGAGGTHKLCFLNDKAYTSAVYFHFYNNATSLNYWSMNEVNRERSLYTILSDNICNRVSIRIVNGTNMGTGGLTLSPMFVPNSTTVTSYIAYENKCPISGFTQANLYVSPTEDEQDATIYNATWQDTVYSGNVNVVSGVLNITHGYWNLSNNNLFKWLRGGGDGTIWYGNIIDNDIFKPVASNNNVASLWCEGLRVRSYSSFANTSSYNCSIGWDTAGCPRIRLNEAITISQFLDAVQDVHIVMELKTPIQIQLSPQEVSTLLGVNNIWSNANGETEVSYYAVGGGNS